SLTATATTDISTLSLHDALPISERHKQLQETLLNRDLFIDLSISDYFFPKTLLFARKTLGDEEYRLFLKLYHILEASFPKPDIRSEEHTSELQSRENLVCRLLLE